MPRGDEPGRPHPRRRRRRPPAETPDWGKLLDIQMMVVVPGKERTKEEFAALFKRAGFRLTRIIPTRCPLSVVEGVAARAK